jgi:site-specific recombinase XerD
MVKYILSERLYRRDWILRSPLRPVAFAYEDFLKQGGYRKVTIHFYLASVAHFAFWISSTGIELSAINRKICERFLLTHLPHCSCPAPRQLQVSNIRAALNHLMFVLDEGKFVVNEVVKAQPIEEELKRFYEHLANVRGLARTTCHYRLRYVRLFLSRNFAQGPIDLKRLSVADVDKFILQFAKRWQPGCLVVVRTALRSYFRYRELQGDQVQSLMACMPVIATVKGTAPHKILKEKQIDIFLRSFDLSTATGQRDYAIARCLLDLGLRGHEVAQLSLDAIDWRNGTVRLIGTKSRRASTLPLPVETGKAIAQYLQNGRPRTNNRAIFVRHVAPYEKPITVSAASNAMNRAFARCGLEREFCGTHIFRHTMAMRLQKEGVSLKIIADALRHQNLESTTRYANADMEQLKKVGLPWPGRR